MLNRRQFLVASAAVIAVGRVATADDAQQQLMRKIPSTGEMIPAMGLGTFNGLMSPDLSEANLSPRREVLKRFYEAGGRLVDTAPSYGNAEEVIGILSEQLKLNDKLFFATKVLERGGEADGIASYQRSMQRLKRDKLELMQCHNFIGWETHLKTLRQWKEQGKFRYIGVTHYQNHAHEELERIIRRDKVDFLQINYSAGEPESAQRLLPVAKDLGVAVIVNRPFAGGGLMKKLQDRPLPDFAKAFAPSWPVALLKFVLANDAVTVAVPATSNPDHLADNMRAGVGPLPSADDCRKLREASA